MQEKEEVWKDIPGYEGFYEVSNTGRVKSIKFTKTRIRKPQIYKEYYYTFLCKNGIIKKFANHQLVAMAFLGHKPCGLTMVVNHINFNKLDNRPVNLEIVTVRENSNRKHLKSTSKYTGVHFHKQHKKWNSSIVFNGKKIDLGLFKNELEASEYYENALKAIQNNEETIKTKHKTITLNQIR